MGEIINVNAVEQYVKDYQEYAMYVQYHRMVPELRDGLKPVQRRIVYAAHEISKASRLRKSANVVGDTMGHFHPHGDSAIQGALYTLINWFNTKMPLFDGRGQFGNTNGDVGAAGRYTETKISNFTYDVLLEDLIKCKEIVDWQQSDVLPEINEPMYLPAKLPLLLVNGASNMAVGDKIDIPTHNLSEVIDATIYLIQNPNGSVVLIPDHCQNCTIIDTDWKEISDKGKGKYKVRGRIEVGTYNGDNKKYKGYPTLHLRSCPSITYLGTIIKGIESMVESNKIIGIVNTEENSTVNDMDYVLILRPGTDPHFIRDAIYKNTRMEQTCSVNFKVIDCLDQNSPTKRLNYSDYIKAWIEFRKMTKLRYYHNRLQKCATNSHMYEMYIWAIESGKADEAISIIKKQKTINDAELIEKLIKKLNVTDIQAKFFINCEIKKLSIAYLNEYKSKKAEIDAVANECRDAILIDGKIEEIIIKELLEIKAKYGTPRTCKIMKKEEATGIPAGEFKVVITENNFIKKIGINDTIPNSKDAIKFVIVGDNSKSLLLFDNVGKVYNIPIHKIPFADRNSSGTDIRLINKYINAPLTCVIYEPVIEKFKNGYLVTLTKNGYIKRMEVTDFLSVPNSGLVYVKNDPNDNVVNVMLFSGNSSDIVVYSKNKALKMSIGEIPLIKRNTRGNISMGGTTTEVEGFSVVLKQPTADIIIVTTKGYFNRISSEAIKSGRSKAGGGVIKLAKGDSIASVISVTPQSVIRCMLNGGSDFVDVKPENIPLSSTVSTGVRLVKGNEITKVILV